MLATAGAAVGITVAANSTSGGLAVHANSIAVIDPATNRLVDDVSVGKRPTAVAVGEGSVWIANADDGTVSRLDLKTRKVVDTVGVGSDVHDLAAGYTSCRR